MSTTTEERKVNPIKASKVKKGDLMALIYFVKVAQVQNKGDDLVVQDLDNGSAEFSVRGRPLVERGLSADQFEEEVKVGKMAAAEILISSPNRPLTVCFEKQDGTERVMKGRLIKHEALLGRSMVEDLETTDKNRLRQVDHRTIKWLVVDGVKYIVK